LHILIRIINYSHQSCMLIRLSPGMHGHQRRKAGQSCPICKNERSNNRIIYLLITNLVALFLNQSLHFEENQNDNMAMHVTLVRIWLLRRQHLRVHPERISLCDASLPRSCQRWCLLAFAVVVDAPCTNSRKDLVAGDASSTDHRRKPRHRWSRRRPSCPCDASQQVEISSPWHRHGCEKGWGWFLGSFDHATTRQNRMVTKGRALLDARIWGTSSFQKRGEKKKRNKREG
jgi:hypothetical protein